MKAKELVFRTFNDSRGSLVGIEHSWRHHDIPFEMRRIFYIWNVPQKEVRGSHAHRTLKQVFVAMAGKFVATLNDGTDEESFILDNPRKGLYVPQMVWCELHSFSKDAVCLVLASDIYDENDYILEHNEFLKEVRK